MADKLNITIPFDSDLDSFVKENHPNIRDFRIISKSLDARGAQYGKRPTYHYILETLSANLKDSYQNYALNFPQLTPLSEKPVIVGAGPAGLFAALRMMEYGVPSTIIERGDSVNNRMKHISKFWKDGDFNPESNVCYGEGGAGLFSDGKLLTRVKSPHVNYVMRKLVEFGAPAETEYLSNPHIGSNKIRQIISRISTFLRESGCEILCNTRVDNLIISGDHVEGVSLSTGRQIKSSNVILATGHSAQDVYNHLYQSGVELRQKDFAIGVRIEHPRQYIDKIQYGDFADDKYQLGAARYRLSWHNKESDRGVYSFCMCPGGYVLSSGTEADGLVTNGMSNFARNSRWSNSALIVSIKSGIDFSSEGLLNGINFQREIEQRAYQISKKIGGSGRELPAQSVGEFMTGRSSASKLAPSSSPSGILKAPLHDILPTFVVNHLKSALSDFDRKIKGFRYDLANIIAPETRTSAPFTIVRDRETLQSTSHQGLYPCGEGAGYAGGITSAAVDGIKAAMAILKKERSLND